MSVVENKAGPGGLAGIAWTPVDGIDLTASQLAQVNEQVAAANTIAQALLEAANGAFNKGWHQFSLNDLLETGALGERGLLARTDLQGNQPNNTPEDWSAFIASALDGSGSAGESLSLAQWRRIADDLQQYAALQASLRMPTLDVSGGVTHANGRWFVNGQALSVLDLYTAVRVNQAVNLDEFIEGLANDITENNRLLKAARAWLALVQNRKPVVADRDESGGTGTISTADRNNFKAEWGVDPVNFSSTRPIAYNTASDQYAFDLWINDIKKYVDLKNTDNQTLQLELTRKSDNKAEVIEALTSFANKAQKTGNLMASNLG